MYHVNPKHKIADVAILISSKVDYKTEIKEEIL